VKKPDGNAVGNDVPERKINLHPNYVTPSGWQFLQKRLNQAEAKRQLLLSQEEMSAKQALASVDRDPR
jgi:hypothetical protein